jgi:methyltransferase (TIGR00027 family)
MTMPDAPTTVYALMVSIPTADGADLAAVAFLARYSGRTATPAGTISLRSSGGPPTMAWASFVNSARRRVAVAVDPPLGRSGVGQEAWEVRVGGRRGRRFASILGIDNYDPETVADGSPSRTAILTAVARAVHREEPLPWVLDDYLALGLADVGGVALHERLRDEVPRELLLAFGRWMGARGRFVEDIVERWVSEGIFQYVILGAGLDSFAYRRRDLLDRLAVFEVDHPATQAWKRHRLAALGVDVPVGLVYAPVDFELDTLTDGLRAAGFDFGQRAIFSWIGTVQFLTLGAIDATLDAIMDCAAGSRVVLTYNLPRDAAHGVLAEVSAAFVGIATEMGEPFVSRFLPDEIDHLLRRHGFGETEDFGPDDARARYFAGRTDVEVGGAERIITATVMPSGLRLSSTDSDLA